MPCSLSLTSGHHSCGLRLIQTERERETEGEREDCDLDDSSKFGQECQQPQDILVSRQCAHKFTSANYTAAIRSKEPIREPDPYLNHGCQNRFTHRMPEEIYAGHSMLLISLFHRSGESVGTRANTLSGPILCLYQRKCGMSKNGSAPAL